MQGDQDKRKGEVKSDRERKLETLIAAAMSIMDGDLRKNALESLEDLAKHYGLMWQLRQKEEEAEREKIRDQLDSAQARQDMQLVMQLNVQEARNVVRYMRETVSLMGFATTEANNFLNSGEEFFKHGINKDGKLDFDINNEKHVEAASRFVKEKDKLVDRIKGGREHNELNEQEKQGIAWLGKMCEHAETFLDKAKKATEKGIERIGDEIEELGRKAKKSHAEEVRNGKVRGNFTISH